MDGAVASVAEIWRYPVRALGGESLRTAQITPTGLAGDRAWTVVDEAGRPLRSRDAPVLATLAAGEVDASALSAAVGRTVGLAALPPPDGVAPVHLVSTAARARAAGGVVPPGCSADDPRANLVLDLADPDDDEREWTGRLLALGDVVLEVTRRPKHCLGVYAEVRVPGTVAVGDAVHHRP